MKAKYAWVALLAVTLFGCDDNTAGLGLGMFPGSDQGINGKLTTFDVTTNSVLTGDIYAKTNVGYVGKFTDEMFGTYQAGFLATLNCPEGQTFEAPYKETDFVNGVATRATGSLVTDFSNVAEKDQKNYFIIKDEDGNNIGNCMINIYLSYTSYFGDSLTACRLSVYQLDKPLTGDKAYYTNIDPKQYYNVDNPILLGTKAYTAVDLSISDSLRNLNSYTPTISLRLSKSMTESLGSTLFQASQADGANFYKKFRELFMGLYVKSDYGDGTVLYVNQVQMDVASMRYEIDSITGLKRKTSAGLDSIYRNGTGRSFLSTREVIQANRLDNDPQKIAELIAEGENTYLKTPAGIFTQATLPISEIQKQLEGDTLNAVKLAFSNYNQTSDKKFGMSIPTNVMLIRKKLKDSFFESNQLSDGISSFLTSHSSSANQYTFSNITKLINACVEDEKAAQKVFDDKKSIEIEVWDETTGIKSKETVNNIDDWRSLSGWNKVVLIPVLVGYDASGNSGGAPNIISVQHDLKPGYVRLKGGSKGELENNGIPAFPDYRLKLEVVSTNFGSK